MDRIADKLKAAGKRFGVSMGYDEEAVRDWAARGASFLFADNDINYLYNGACATLSNLKRLSQV
jgi:2,4-dihydroxyhept-2-ene-1,7-dioic acid aldolase